MRADESSDGGPGLVAGQSHVSARASAGHAAKYAIPRPRNGPLRRQRLVDSLYENIDHPLQLICAPAGYGKTTLLADFAEDTDLTVCWYGVDELDSDPGSFLTHLYDAVSSRFPSAEYPDFSGAAPPPDRGQGWQPVVNRFVAWIEGSIPEYFILIVDDFHLVSSNPAAAEALNLLIQRLPENCRLVVSAREVPELASLPKLISERKVAGLGAVELRFTSAEVKELFKTHFDLDITPEEANHLAEESEGWIVSILLTTHFLWKGLLREVVADRGRNTLLYEYIASEVFSLQEPGMQEFLLSTSICGKFDTALAEALTGSGADGALEAAESKNLFLTRLGGSHPWYQYHHLFRDFLREKLRKRDPSRFLMLNTTAAEHYLSLGDRRQAVFYYIQGSEFQKAVDLLEELAEPLSHEGLWDTLGSWLDKIPEELQTSRPQLLLYMARINQIRGKNDDAIKMLNDAIDLFREKGDRLLEARALMRRSVSLRHKGAHQMAVRDARAALGISREDGSALDVADAHNHLGLAFAQQFRLPRAEGQFKAALAGYQQVGNLFQLSEINDRLGSIYNERGEYSRALSHFELARQGWQKLGNQRELAVTLNNTAFLYYQQARFDAAAPLARESASLAQAAGSPRDEAHALMTLSETLREQGEYSEALGSCQRGLSLARQCMETHLVGYGSVALGETYRLQGELDKARATLQEGIALAVEHGQEYEKALGLISLGIIEYEEKRYEDGEASLAQACEELKRSGQKWALARASLHLAHVLFLSKKYATSLEQLDLVAQLCEELGQEQFLAREARGMHLLIQYGATRSKSADLYRRFAEAADDAAEPEMDGEGDARKPPVPATRVEVWTLGSPRVLLDGTAVISSAWGSAKAREMFLYMLHRPFPLHKEKIVEALWPEIASSKANSNFHSTMYRLRRALNPNCVERDGELYQLNPSWSYWWDAQEFQRLLTEAGQAPRDSDRWESLHESAVDLHRGPFAEDIDSEWCDEVRNDIERQLLRALHSLSERRIAGEDYQRGIDLLEQSLALDDLQEELYYKIIELYLMLDDRASASRVYRRCESIFGETPPLSDSQEVRRLLARLS